MSSLMLLFPECSPGSGKCVSLSIIWTSLGAAAHESQRHRGTVRREGVEMGGPGPRPPGTICSTVGADGATEYLLP